MRIFCNLSNSKSFFSDGDYRSYEQEFIANINEDLKDVRKFLKEIKTQASMQSVPTRQALQVEIQPQYDIEGQVLGNPNIVMQTLQTKPNPTILRQAQPTAQPVQIPSKLPEKNLISKPEAQKQIAKPTPQVDTQPQATAPAKASTAMEDYTAKTNARIELQKQIAAFEAERTERSRIRLEANQQKISAWHKKQAEVIQSVKTLQEPTQKLLEHFINFSGMLTKNYVIRFANTYIELFNLILDNLRSHEPKAKAAQSQDYYNAVANYEDYLDTIVDTLADFGIEEISSNEGSPFDGKIHDVKNTRNFSPKFATVKKSLRTGFRYGDLILQKEQVEV